MLRTLYPLIVSFRRLFVEDKDSSLTTIPMDKLEMGSVVVLTGGVRVFVLGV